MNRLVEPSLADRSGLTGLNSFAWLIDRLAYEPRRNGKLALLGAYFRETPDPDRGHALAAMTGALRFANAKPGLIRSLIMERVDPVLFALSYDYVGDLSETVALMWPVRAGSAGRHRPAPSLTEVVEGLATADRADLPGLVACWLDALDETGRWALLKLITGALRIGVSARLAKTAVGDLGGVPADEVEQVWHGLSPPYEGLFAWIEGRGPRPQADDPAPFRPPMLAHPINIADCDRLSPADFAAEWKWDGIRIQIASGRDAGGRQVTRLYSRTGEDISSAFPDLVEALAFDGAIDGELLILRAGQVQSFNVLQQRLNRKTVTAKLLADFPAHVRAYDLLAADGQDWRDRPYRERRARLAQIVAAHAGRDLPVRLDLSREIPFDSWEALAAARAEPQSVGAGADTEAIEGCMIKRLDSPYLPGRPRGYWFKWKRDPRLIDCVLMYAQRGHGKRSSYYSDYTFGCWRDGAKGRELAPVGKAYSGFTDEELVELDRFVRRNTINRFGPVREVVHEPARGLVFEIAFEGLQRSARHKSGIAMRFPRINRIRWDKPPADADELATLEAMLAAQTQAP